MRSRRPLLAYQSEHIERNQYMANPNVLEFTANNFQAEVLSSDQPVLVDFWAEWCGPCRMLTPTIEKLANNYVGKAKIGKLNVDNAQMLAAQFNVMSIPTVMVFKGGQPVATMVGLRGEAEIAGAIDAALK